MPAVASKVQAATNLPPKNYRGTSLLSQPPKRTKGFLQCANGKEGGVVLKGPQTLPIIVVKEKDEGRQRRFEEKSGGKHLIAYFEKEGSANEVFEFLEGQVASYTDHSFTRRKRKQGV